jgi:hypothetical protein
MAQSPPNPSLTITYRLLFFYMVCLRSWCRCRAAVRRTARQQQARGASKAGDGDRTSGADADGNKSFYGWRGVARQTQTQTFALKLVRRNVWGVHRPWRVAQDDQMIVTAANGPHERSQMNGKLEDAAIAARVATDDVEDGKKSRAAQV